MVRPQLSSVRSFFLSVGGWIVLFGAAIALTTNSSHAIERIKEVASISGVRSNPLVGYGLVVGLDGTGDQTTQAPFTGQSVRSMLETLGVSLPPGTAQLRNVAAVLVTADLPPMSDPANGWTSRFRRSATQKVSAVGP